MLKGKFHFRRRVALRRPLKHRCRSLIINDMKHVSGGYCRFTVPDLSNNNGGLLGGERERRSRPVKLIERIEGSYEVQDAPFGKVYKWRPENFVVECERLKWVQKPPVK